MQRNGMCQALHHRVEEAGIACILHAKAYSVLQEYPLSWHKTSHFGIIEVLHFTFEIILIFLTFGPLHFELLSSLRSNCVASCYLLIKPWTVISFIPWPSSLITSPSVPLVWFVVLTTWPLVIVGFTAFSIFISTHTFNSTITKTK